MFLTAFPLLAALLTRDPILISGITIATKLPWLLFSLFTGAISDRMDRRRLMIGSDIARFAIVASLAATIVTDHSNIWVLYTCAFSLGICETLHTNCAQAILPDLISPDQLMDANARFTSAQVTSAQFVGPSLGVILFNTASAIPFAANAITFAGSAALIKAIPNVHGVESPTTRLRDDMLDGIKFLRDNPVLRRLTAILATLNFFYFAAAALLVLYTSDLLHSGELTFTALSVGAALGTVASRFLVGPLSKRLKSSGIITFALWVWAITSVGIAFTSSRYVAIASYIILGIGNGLWMIVNTTLRQQLTPARMLGRMNAAFRTVSWGVVPFGAAFGGVTARYLGLRGPFIIYAVVMVGCAVFARPILKPLRTEAIGTTVPA
jgi:MFS family permease